MHAWLTKWYFEFCLKFRYRFVKATEVKPFLQIDPNEYCLACGHRDGEIQAVDLAAPDESGALVGIAHGCKVCKYQWVEPAVTLIKVKMFHEEESEEELTFREMATDKRTLNVRGVVKVGAK